MTSLHSITHVIDGRPTAGTGTRVGPVFDPATGVQQAEVRLACAVDVDEAVAGAVGAAAVISPFNFPAMVPLRFVPIAIAAGNAVVLKPSEKDPTAATLLVEAFLEAGLPPGVLNVVHGDKEAVDGCWSPPTSKRCPSSARPRAPATSTRPAPATASGYRPSAGRRTTCWCCRTPTSIWPPTPR